MQNKAVIELRTPFKLVPGSIKREGDKLIIVLKIVQSEKTGRQKTAE